MYLKTHLLVVKTIKILGLGLLFLFGCEEKPVVVQDESVYFPLRVGSYQLYQVDETLYSEVNPPEIKSYQLKIETVDSIQTIEGDFQYVLYRSTRSTAVEPWEYMDTWSARRSPIRAILQEGNTSFVKLEFPLRENREWDGNTFNTLGEDVYEAINIKQPYMIEGLPEFSKTITVKQSDNQDLIVFQDKRSEVYARDIGLIEKKVLQLHYYTLPVEDIGKQKIKNGVEYTQRLIEYGAN
jgi:hypothetical protein